VSDVQRSDGYCPYKLASALEVSQKPMPGPPSWVGLSVHEPQRKGTQGRSPVRLIRPRLVAWPTPGQA
jgi:hypothetical protein